MTLEDWLYFCATEIVLCFTPGPATLLVFSTTLARGFFPGLWGSLGILTTNALYFALSATGVAAILLASNELFSILKWAGAAYLLWIGLRMLIGRPESALAAETATPPQASHRSFLRGMVVQGANPKTLIFFVALLPQFVDPQAPVGFQILVMGVTSVLIEFVVLLLYAFVGMHARQVAGPKFAGRLERVGGGFLVAAAAKLALSFAPK